MSKKTATIIIIIFVVLLVGGLIAFYFYANQGQGNGIGTTDVRGNIFPTSKTGNGAPHGNTTATTTTVTTPSTITENQPILTIKELSTKPSAGAVAIATTTSITPLVRFIERGTGNVYEVRPDSNTETRLSNTTIAKISEAFWNKGGTRVLARYTGDNGDSIKTYSALLTKSLNQPEGELQGVFLTENIRSLAVNPDKSKVFYLLEHSAGSTGIVSDFDGTKKTQIFDSLLSEWLPDWPTATRVSLTSKASAGVPGFMYLLNTQTGALTRAISGIVGLTTLVNSDASSALYSESGKDNFALKIYSFKTATVKDVAIQTLPEKCVWSKNDLETIYCSVPTYMPTGAYPDIWYQGLVSFSDEIWKIDGRTGAGELIGKLKNATRADIDGVNLFLSPKEDYLFFTNKNDFHLWSVRLQQ